MICGNGTTVWHNSRVDFESFAEQTLYDIPVVVVDTETTGLYHGLGHRVVEIAAIRFEDWQAVGQMSQLVFPERSMEPKATEICGIADADLVGKPRFRDVATAFSDLIDGALLVAHNAVFDAGFIGQEYTIAELVAPGALPLPNPWLCTLKLARGYFHFGRNNLSNIARQLNVRMGVAHRALSDVYMTAEVLRRMDQQLTKQNIMTVGDLLHAQGETIVTPPAPNIDLRPPLDQAVANKQDLQILYIGNEGQTNRRITPRFMAEHRGHPYLIAFCQLRNEQRAFKLDRIFDAFLV